jgi:hypothetical protein
MKYFTQDSMCLSIELNPGLPEYERGVIITTRRRSVSLVQKNGINENKLH